MKRDMDLIRNILMHAEQHSHGFCAEGSPEIDGYTAEQVGYHVYLMEQAGLVAAHSTTVIGSSSPSAALINLTWYGHDFLDAARQPERWAQAKKIINKVGSVSFDVLLSLLAEMAHKAIEKTL